MELNDILSKMEAEGWEIDFDFKENNKGFLQYFLETVQEQCNIANVVGQSEQLLAFKEWERHKCRLPWDAEPKEIVEQYLSQ